MPLHPDHFGLTVEQLRQMADAAAQTGVSLDEFGRALVNIRDRLAVREDRAFIDGAAAAGSPPPAGLVSQGNAMTLPIAISRREINGVVVEFAGPNGPVIANIEEMPPQETISQTITELRFICQACGLHGIEHGSVDQVIQILLPMVLFQPVQDQPFGMTFGPAPIRGSTFANNSGSTPIAPGQLVYQRNTTGDVVNSEDWNSGQGYVPVVDLGDYDIGSTTCLKCGCADPVFYDGVRCNVCGHDGYKKASAKPEKDSSPLPRRAICLEGDLPVKAKR